MEDAISREIKDFKYKDYYRFRVSYIIESNFLFLFINSINDSLNKIEKELKRFKEEFFNLTNSTSYDFSDEQINNPKIIFLNPLIQEGILKQKPTYGDHVFVYQTSLVTEFINKTQAVGELEKNSHIWYSCTIYCEAYNLLLNYFLEEVDKSRYMMIPLSDLSNEEIQLFHEIHI